MSPPDPRTATPAFEGNERFEVLGPLGVGGMAVVHRARDRQLGDVVALKTLKHLDSDSLYRLKQEFRALSSFDHPNLVSFYELLKSTEGWFVTMELVEGVDFLTWCRGEEEGERSFQRTQSTWRSATDLRFARSAPAGKALTPDNMITEPIEALPDSVLPDLLRLRSSLRQLTEGVMALHAGGRIHRDLKPSNVLVTDAGRVVILDFGLVADIDQDYTEGTLHQTIAGSAAYMSPEQAVGVPLTEAADWYAVGVMLYEGLTGRWPFSGALYKILTQKNSTDPSPPSAVNPEVPPDLDELCLALLQRDPAARPTGPEVLAVLRHHEAGSTGPRLMVPLRFRDDALHQLHRAYQIAASGTPTCAVVRGARGAGKTQLVREAIKHLHRLEPPPVTLKGRCFEWENVPYKAIDGLIDNLARVLRRADTELTQAVSREELGWLAALFPVVSRASALDLMPADTKGVPEEVIAQRGFAQLDRLLEVLCAYRPVVAFIDDVHWGDLQSAQALAALVGKPGRRLLLMFTVDAGAQAPFLAWLGPELQRRGVRTGQIDLPPLAPESSLRLAAEMLQLRPNHPEARKLAEASGGLPGRLRELVRQRMTAGAGDDDELDEVRIADIRGLPAAPRRLLELLALAQAPVPTEVAVVSAQLGDDAVDAVSTLRAHRLCDVSGATGEALQVGSRAVADFVTDELADDVRRRHHRALAAGLEQTGDADPVRLITHLVGGGEGHRAATMAWIAANRALERGDPQRGVHLLELALDHGDWPARERVGMIATLGRAHGLRGQPHHAVRALTAAVEEAPESARPELRVHRVVQLLDTGDVDRGVAELEALQSALGLPGFPSGLFAGGVAAWRRFRTRQRGHDFQQRVRVDVEASQLVAVDLAWACVGPLERVDPARAFAYHPTHLSTALDVGEVDRVIRALGEEVVSQVRQGESPDAAQQRLDQLVAAYPSARAEATALSTRARVRFLRGEVAKAAQASTEAEVRMRRAGMPSWRRHQLRAIRLQCLVWTGQLADVAGQLDDLLARAVHDGHLAWAAEVAGITARVRMAQGRTSETRQALGDWLDRLPPSRCWALGVVGLAELAAYEGDDGAAVLGRARAEVDKRRFGEDPLLGTRWTRAEGLCARAAGDARGVQRACKTLRGWSVPWGAAWADLIEGKHRAASETLRRLGFGLELAAVGVHLDDGASARWLTEHGVGDVERLVAWIAPD
jgi:serine/threonine protein kinase